MTIRYTLLKYNADTEVYEFHKERLMTVSQFADKVARKFKDYNPCFEDGDGVLVSFDEDGALALALCERKSVQVLGIPLGLRIVAERA